MVRVVMNNHRKYVIRHDQTLCHDLTRCHRVENDTDILSGGGVREGGYDNGNISPLGTPAQKVIFHI